MDPAHKQILRRNRAYIVENLDNLASVFDKLVERNLYHPEDYEDFKVKGGGMRGTVRLFLNSIEKRGPNAFDSFIHALRDSKHGCIANLLDPASAAQYPAQLVSRPGRADRNPEDYTGAQGDSQQQEGGSQPMDVEASSFNKPVIACPSEENPQNVAQPAEPDPKVWPGNSSALLTDKEMTVAMDDSADVDSVYQMKSKPRGIAVIINNKHFRSMNTRKGTDIDGKNLQHVFEKLGFNVILNNDVTGEEMTDLISEVAAHNHQSFDCFILAILSHGIEGAIYGTNERILKIETIVKYFEGGRCPSLAGKPKLFFLQACRGEKFDSGIEATDGTREVQQPTSSSPTMTDDERAKQMLERELQDEADSSNAYRAKLPSQSDMLIAYATVPGFVSWRNSERGSWFVQALSEVLIENAHKEDLLSMLTMVNNKVAQAFESSSGRNKQIPAPVTMLRKKVFFNPGR